MKSRYDFMEASKVCDTDGQPYPDVLTTNYSDFSLTKIPPKHIVNIGNIKRFWKYMYDTYGIAYYDDILLNMNQIGYIGELEPGYRIYEFDLNDIENFNNNKRKEVE